MMKKSIIIIILILAQFKAFGMAGTYLQEKIVDQKTALILFDKQTNKPIGFSIFTREQGCMTLEDLTVDKKRRGQGFGSYLLQETLERAKKNQTPLKIQVTPIKDTYPKNPTQKDIDNLIKFYTTHGAQLVERRELDADVVFKNHLL